MSHETPHICTEKLTNQTFKRRDSHALEFMFLGLLYIYTVHVSYLL